MSLVPRLVECASLRLLPRNVFLPMLTPDPFRLFHVSNYTIRVPSLCSCGWKMVRRASTGRVPSLDILDARSAEEIGDFDTQIRSY